MPENSSVRSPMKELRPTRKPRASLFVRVYAASGLPEMASQGIYCKLYVGPSNMSAGSRKSFSASDHNDIENSYVSFHTAATKDPLPTRPMWNEKFHVSIANPELEVLTIRVKAERFVYAPVIGACVIPLAELAFDQVVDQSFTLRSIKPPVMMTCGQLRLQLLLSPPGGMADEMMRSERAMTSTPSPQRWRSNQGSPQPRFTTATKKAPVPYVDYAPPEHHAFEASPVNSVDNNAQERNSSGSITDTRLSMPYATLASLREVSRMSDYTHRESLEKPPSTAQTLYFN